MPLCLLLAFAIAHASEPLERKPGQSYYFSFDPYVEYVAGDLPIVLTSPHGGRLKPDTIRNRTKGVTDMDVNTQELARAVLDALHALSGRHAHLVASHLHRSKLDPNREIVEAAQGDPMAERAWREFHDTVRLAIDSAVARHGFAFLIDLHGHAHPIPRLELGYALSTRQLNVPDAEFDRSGVIAVSTLRDLHARRGGSAAALLRGPRSLGALFAARGLRAIPSPAEPQPEGHPYFNGGYIVRRHAAAPDTPKVDGLQIECPRAGVRDTAEARARFANITAEVLAVFLQENHDFRLDAKK
ncbi:MAG: N-formylglutamate amidohydrolase [Opitutaceae bacterium]|nr:N-formylglutamate amidohydrolase [Opitutaceae bacterium]